MRRAALSLLGLALVASSATAAHRAHAERAPELLAPSISALASGARVSIPILGKPEIALVTSDRRLTFVVAGAKLGPDVSPGELAPASVRGLVTSVRATQTPKGVEVTIELREPVVAEQSTREDELGTTLELTLSAPRSPSSTPAKRPVDDEDAPAPVVRGPVVIPVLFESAFVQTHFGFEIEVSQTSFKLPATATAPATPVSLLGGFERLSFGAKIFDWLTADIAASTRLVLGGSDATSKSLGTDALLGARFGVNVFLDRLAAGTFVGLRVSGGVSTGGELLTEQQVLDISQVTMVAPETLEDVTAPLSEREARFAVHAAQVLGRLTLQSAVGGTGFVHSYEIGPVNARIQHRYSGSDFNFGVSALFDWRPVGISAEYALSSPVSRTQKEVVGTSQLLAFENAHAFGGGLYFTGRRELSLGAFVSGTLRQESLARRSVAGRLAFVYVF